MPLFKCTYAKCVPVIQDSTRMPVRCPHKPNCDFEVMDAAEAASAAASRQSAASTLVMPREQPPAQPYATRAQQHTPYVSESIPRPAVAHSTVQHSAFDVSDDEGTRFVLGSQHAAAPPLTMRIAGQEFAIASQTILGRNGDVARDIFRGMTAVSREHCQLTPRDQTWWLKNLSTSSPTELNGREVSAQQSARLISGTHQLVLGQAVTVTLIVGRETTVAPADDDDGFPDPFATSGNSR